MTKSAPLEPTVEGRLFADPRRLERLHQAVLAVVDGAADAAYPVRRLVLHAKPEVHAVGLSQVHLEGLKGAPDVDDVRMIRRFEPVDDSKAFRPLSDLLASRYLNSAG
jgi:hypothetical protein